MLAKVISPCLALLLSAATLHAAAPSEPSSKFDSSAAYGVPSIVLPPGSFSIGVVGHIGKRYIVHIEDQAGDVLATFLGVPSTNLGPSPTGKVNWAARAQGITYMKGFYFPSASLGLEFVYPKTDAIAIAQANNASVAAIDPASDGLLMAQPKNISAKDLEIVTLWLLTPTRVGANHAAGIEAQRYEQAVSAEPQVASAPPPAASARPVTPAPNPEPQVASLAPHRRPALRTLPHTASNLPLFYLVGILSFTGAMGMRLKRSAVVG